MSDNLWYELKIAALPANLASFEESLENNQSVLALTLQSADETEMCLEPAPGEFPIWNSSILTALFNEETALLGAIHQLKLSPEMYYINIFPQENWVEKCRKQFKPKKFGQRLWLCPTWHQAPEDAEKVIWLDPGVAFGTGEHETTSLCLSWLDEHIQPEQRVLDFGCGTGILAIAALKLGASFACAVDIDPQAVQASIENAALNGVQDQMRVMLPSDYQTEDRFDVIVANILAKPLASLKKTFLDSLEEGGSLVVSGILQDQSEWIEQAFAPELRLSASKQEGNWVCLCFK